MKEQILIILDKSKKYTLKVAEIMPEETYDFKPPNAGWNFKEILNHIAYGIKWWEEYYIKNIKSEWQPPEIENNKEVIISNLISSYENLKNTINILELNENVIYGFFAALDHITHHRGQAVIYLRCKGLEPPEYSY